MQKSFKMFVASTAFAASNLISYLPNNLLRIALLRLLGARIGRGCAIHRGLQVRAIWRLEIGDDVFIGDGVMLDARGGLQIGNSTSINSRAQIWSAQHDIRSPDFAYQVKAVRVGHHAWVSSGAIVIPGADVSDGAVIAAGAVLTRPAEGWGVYGGNPAVRVSERPIVDNYRLNARSNKIWWV